MVVQDQDVIPPRAKPAYTSSEDIGGIVCLSMWESHYQQDSRPLAPKLSRLREGLGRMTEKNLSARESTQPLMEFILHNMDHLALRLNAYEFGIRLALRGHLAETSLSKEGLTQEVIQDITASFVVFSHVAGVAGQKALLEFSSEGEAPTPEVLRKRISERAQSLIAEYFAGSDELLPSTGEQNRKRYNVEDAVSWLDKAKGALAVARYLQQSWLLTLDDDNDTTKLGFGSSTVREFGWAGECALKGLLLASTGKWPASHDLHELFNALPSGNLKEQCRNGYVENISALDDGRLNFPEVPSNLEEALLFHSNIFDESRYRVGKMRPVYLTPLDVAIQTLIQVLEAT